MVLHSKNLTSLKKIINCIIRYQTKSATNRFIQSKQKKRVRFNILTSPHVNKTAQDAFQITFYMRSLTNLLSINFIIFIKKLTATFPDVRSKLKLSYKSKTKTLKYLFLFNPDKLTNGCQTAKLTSKPPTCAKALIKYFNIYGKTQLFCLNSSVVEHRTENPCVGSSSLPLDK